MHQKPWYATALDGYKKLLVVLLTNGALSFLGYEALVKQPIGWSLAAFMVGIIFTIGFVTTTYIGKQAALDSYVRGMLPLVSGVSNPANINTASETPGVNTVLP